MRNNVVRIALLGAESTGKTRLAIDLAQTLQAIGIEAVNVPETLREWCDTQGRTPLAYEQLGIAEQQAERIFSIQSGWVIADTSPLMTAVYSDFIFHDVRQSIPRCSCICKFSFTSNRDNCERIQS